VRFEILTVVNVWVIIVCGVTPYMLVTLCFYTSHPRKLWCYHPLILQPALFFFAFMLNLVLYMCSFSPVPVLCTFHTLLSSVVIYSPLSVCDLKQTYHYLCTIQGHFSSVTCVSTSGPGRLQTCIMLCRNQHAHVHSTTTPCIDFSYIAFTFNLA